jgi:predicted DNA repair protein MutK
MAGTSLLALIDDIAAILDDVSIMTKVAAKKTAGVLGDDLALNAQQVSGVNSERELPVVWAVARGSFINKIILVPAALAVSALAPWAVLPLLMIGGAYLCYEGVEKLAHSLLPGKHGEKKETAPLIEALRNPAVDLVAHEKNKIKGAVRTDFILSAEIIVIALGTVASAPFTQRFLVLSAVGVLMTVGVYGLVGGIVKLDDLGLYLTRRGSGALGALSRKIGGLLLAAAPLLMKTLSVLGTAAMFLVGGGILSHGWHGLNGLIEKLAHYAAEIRGIGGLLKAITPTLLDALTGIVIGAIILTVVTVGGRLWNAGKKRG